MQKDKDESRWAKIVETPFDLLDSRPLGSGHREERRMSEEMEEATFLEVKKGGQVIVLCFHSTFVIR
jgi:hypothetical protein